MKQSKESKCRANTALIYLRLSREDDIQGDSYSIQNQKKLLTKEAKARGFTNFLYFVDDGITGVIMNRKGFNNLVEAIIKRKGAAVFVKDLSRLGRNYIEVGRLMEDFFPEHDIRLIAVSDGIDTDEGESEMAPIRNLFNEWYSRDISKKRRWSNSTKGNSGIPLGPPPYGYQKDPEDKNRWIIDPDAADVVRYIYQLAFEGFGTEQISTKLQDERILTPMNYWNSKGLKRGGRANTENPYKWENSTVIKILAQQEYVGDLINFKTYSKSYKHKRRLKNSEDKMAIFPNNHEPIIERELWERQQKNRGVTRKRRTSTGEKNMFSGILVCADCGTVMNFHFNQANPDIKYFNCTEYNKKGKRGNCNSTHYIRVDFLEQIVLGEIRRLTKFASKYENQFVEAVDGLSLKLARDGLSKKKRELSRLRARHSELDNLFERIYEDNVSGKITDDRFATMSKRYEDEQAEIVERMTVLAIEVEKESTAQMSTETFIKVVRKYTRARKLTERMLNELIEKIEVYNAEKIDGVHVQRVRIHYNCIGSLDIPEELPLPIPDVTVETRKGVAVSYTPMQTAV